MFRRVFGFFWQIFDQKLGGHIRNVDITPQFLIENRLKRTEKSTEDETANTLLCLLIPTILVASPPVFESIVSLPEQVVTLTADEASLISKVLNPLSGQIILSKTDLIAKGAQDVSLTRVYIAPHISSLLQDPKSGWKVFWDRKAFYTSVASHYRGWTFLPHLYAIVKDEKVRFTDRSGLTLDFSLSNSTMVTAPFGINNCSHETPKGVFDPRNTRIDKSGSNLFIETPDGRMLHYVQKDRTFRYDLRKEILANGKILRYSYANDRPVLVESLDPKERYVYASISLKGLSMEGSPVEEASSAESNVKDSTKYQSYTHTVKETCMKKHTVGKYAVSFPYALTTSTASGDFSETTSYTPEMQLKQYLGKREHFQCTYEPFEGPESVLRVKTLSMPSGELGAMSKVYEMNYDPPVAGQKDGSTSVQRIDGIKTVYQFSKELLTQSIRMYRPDAELAKEKIFTWDENNYLKAIECKDGNGSLFYRKEFESDEFGNPIVERFIGDLTGEGSLDTITTLREFSKDGKHLLLREENEEGKIIIIRYLSGTNLPTAKYTFGKNSILLREFYNYDDCNNLIEKISDDGTVEDQTQLTDVTERKITRYHLRTTAPFLHMPEWVEEWCLEEGVETLLGKTHLLYDHRGNVELEQVYGSDGVLAYQITRKTNEEGNVLWESDPLGYKIHTTYNSLGLPIFQTSKSGKLTKTMHYDDQRRLCKLEEKTVDGTEHVTTWHFDELDRCINKEDYLGNSISYHLDPLTGSPIQIDAFPIVSLDGVKVPVQTKAVYDALDRRVSDTDANANTIFTRYNAYNSPVEVTYPDGSKETYRYYKNGDLKSHTNSDGLTITYSWDLLGRLEKKKYGSYAVETFVYDALHLRSHIDKEKHLTEWEYDGAGRKISETKEERTIQFSYNSLGKLASENHSGLRIIEYTRDVLGQVLEEWTVDATNQIFTKVGYNYDGDGLRTWIIRYPNDLVTAETFVYDGFSRLIKHRDELGFLTTTTYDESQTNVLGQRILTATTLDPNQISTTITYDPYHRQTLKQVGSLFSKKLIFDPVGNLQQVEIGDRLTRYCYDCRNRVKSLTRGFMSSQPRTFSYSYTYGGKLKTKRLPSGITLTYDHDVFGYPTFLISSDHRISQIFKYNFNGDLLFASDGAHTLNREVDPFGNIVQETIDDRLTLIKTYDDLNRLLTLVLPDQSSIRYVYDAAYLRSVNRYSADEVLLYSHGYSSYDKSRQAGVEQLIKGLGEISHTWNHRRQAKSLTSPYFQESVEYDPGGRVESISENHFKYDDLSQIIAEKSAAYAYDAYCNRTEKNGVVTNYNSLNEIEKPDVSYDVDGNLEYYEDCWCRYDPLQRLTAAGNNSTEVWFTYDGLGRCQSKTLNDKEEFYLYHGPVELGSFTADGKAIAVKIPGLDCNPIALEIQDKIYAPLLDHRGNLRRLIDVETRQIIESCEYTAFGEEAPFQKITSPWRYFCKRYEAGLRLYYFGNRWYDPALGRFLTIDPEGSVGGVPFSWNGNER